MSAEIDCAGFRDFTADDEALFRLSYAASSLLHCFVQDARGRLHGSARVGASLERTCCM
jgi:hypothetical protein